MLKIAPSILSADFARLGDQIREAEAGGADYIHVDVMDGHFVPNITIGAPIVRAIRPVTRLPLDVHLMIESPERFLKDFAEAGADLITVHQEACVHLHRTIEQIRSLGKRAGVSINPATPAGVLDEILPYVDLVLVMTVNPGFGGQSFIESMLAKIRDIHQRLAALGSAAELEVDGGVSYETAPMIAAAGASVLVAGSSVFGAKEGIAKAIAEIRRRAEAGAVR
ncbi:MAG TPA: ribulose-phosphate 3-epimerase [Anaerolineales bacterium]|nr:ribulose-phosphate 3-epimerase [Anaerolineales bacterium]